MENNNEFDEIINEVKTSFNKIKSETIKYPGYEDGFNKTVSIIDELSADGKD